MKASTCSLVDLKITVIRLYTDTMLLMNTKKNSFFLVYSRPLQAAVEIRTFL